MLNIKDSYATTFQVEVEEKYVQANLSTSKKNPTTESGYENMSWRTRFVGQAFDKAKELTNGSRIKITNGVVENKYDKEKKVLYVNVTVFDFEPVE